MPNQRKQTWDRRSPKIIRMQCRCRGADSNVGPICIWVARRQKWVSSAMRLRASAIGYTNSKVDCPVTTTLRTLPGYGSLYDMARLVYAAFAFALVFGFAALPILDRQWFSSFECESSAPSIYKTDGPYWMSFRPDRSTGGLIYRFGTLHSTDDVYAGIPANISKNRYDTDKLVTVESNIFGHQWAGMAGNCHSDRTVIGSFIGRDELISCQDPSRGWAIEFKWKPSQGVTWMRTKAGGVDGTSTLQSGPGLAKMCRNWPV